MNLTPYSIHCVMCIIKRDEPLTPTIMSECLKHRRQRTLKDNLPTSELIELFARTHDHCFIHAIRDPIADIPVIARAPMLDAAIEATCALSVIARILSKRPDLKQARKKLTPQQWKNYKNIQRRIMPNAIIERITEHMLHIEEINGQNPSPQSESQQRADLLDAAYKMFAPLPKSAHHLLKGRKYVFRHTSLRQHQIAA